MIKINYIILLLTSTIPLILAYVWFHTGYIHRLLKLDTHNELTFKWSIGNIIALFILSFMYSITISYQVIHQLHFQSMLMNEVGFDKGEGNAYKDLVYILELYGKNFRSFGHGAFHGFLNSVFIIFPILYFQKLVSNWSWKMLVYIWSFWAICSMIMGAIICELY
ncbi:MAG: hypothetical protein JNL75_07455 [Chitinophagales bacterium]|nr:hypothetical protein [Chitinophagales bacterium]